MTIPNILSLLRIFSLPFLFYLIRSGHEVAAFYLLIGSWFTDLLDGFIARTFNQRSKLGSYLDPIADKVVTASLFVFLTLYNRIPLWLTSVVVSRDVVLLGGLLVVFMPQKFPVTSPSYLGKFTTFSQALTLLVVMSDGVPALKGYLSQFRVPILYATLVLTVLSLVQYVFRGISMLRHRETNVDRA
ncbi:MAG: CDP-alcohol phosphatidyltransferase family protein [Deltaproteobacteria bacterium]|nr:CDP-alcohol phosphatidyltransferase family protein [Deltaproteobacteria bacterium]MCL5277083.1 CDP-alcohol phosphatidyltransferase family protein [Deltaproteobacteria bacterium]